MSIKSGLSYDVKNDYIDGYENMDDYGISTDFAQQSIVFMIKGNAITLYFVLDK